MSVRETTPGWFPAPAVLPRPRIAATVRLFCLVTMAVPVAWVGLERGVAGLLVLTAIWSFTTAASLLRRVPTAWLHATEATAVALAVIVSFSDQSVLLPALVVAPIVAALERGSTGLATVVTVQTGVGFLALLQREPAEPEIAVGVLSWLVTGLGLGLVTTYVRAVLPGTADGDSSYREARALLTELLSLSPDLRHGLEPESLAQEVLATTGDHLPVRTGAVWRRDGHAWQRLAVSGPDAPPPAEEEPDLLQPVWDTAAPVVRTDAVALPLRTDAGTVAVLVADLAPDHPGGRPDPLLVLPDLEAALRAPTLRLDAALLFDRARDVATRDERQRLARELHDGPAQAIASLGYLVDQAAREPASESQAAVLHQLRESLSSIVAEVRETVTALRSDPSDSESLGAAVARLGRQLSTTSAVSVRVTADEGDTRLRPAVEAELLRITQEAMSNAVQHSQGSRVDVTCRVSAPAAEISVVDDGRGLGGTRPDSYGLQIMQERARLVGATLAVGARADGHDGTEVVLHLGDPGGTHPPAEQSTPEHDTGGAP